MKSVSILAFLSIILLSISMITFYADTAADARARGGGRSFGGSRSYSPSRSASRPYARQPSRSGTRSGGNSFSRGLGGGLLGGFLGSMLFGSLAHAGGGFGGSGIGLFQLLIIGGIGYFFYKKFFANKASGERGPGGDSAGYFSSRPDYSSPPPPPTGGMGTIDAPPPGGPAPYSAGQQADPMEINEQEIKELAQDIFFKVQAAWMRRDLDAARGILGPELLAQYQSEFQDMNTRGVVNRLENIAVRNVEIVDYGRESGFEFVKVKFYANLLDYTVEESTGRVVEGSDREPVKFEEIWTLARPEGSTEWKLYQVEEK